MQFKLLFCLLFSLFISSCANNLFNNVVSEEDLFNSAQQYLNNKNYSAAITQLELIESRYPFGYYADEVKLQLMFSHYKNGDYEKASSQANRFIRFNVGHPQSDYAYFVKGLANYTNYQDNNSNILKRGPESFDQKKGQQAFDDFKILVEYFPESDYRADAIAKMRILREQFANHDIRVGIFYQQNKNYIAAINRANYVLENFPSSQSQGDALALLVLSHQQLKNNQQAEQALGLLKQYFPKHKALSSGQFSSPFEDKKRWWLQVLSLGFFS